MILDTNTLSNYMESFANGPSNDGIPALTVRDFSECSSVMEASMQAQQEQAEAWQSFNQRIAYVEATYLRENGVAMVYTEANIKELIQGGIALLQRGWSAFMGILQKGMDAIKKWITGNAEFVKKNKSKMTNDCKFPTGKEFESYNYKDAMDKANDVSVPSSLVAAAKSDNFQAEYAKFVNSIGGSDGKLTVAKFKTYLLGDSKATINGSYLPAIACVDQMQRATGMITLFKNSKQKAEKDYKDSIAALKAAQRDGIVEQGIHKYISNLNRLIALNTNMLTAKLQICSNYISQIDRIARIYVASIVAKNNQIAANEPKLLGDGSDRDKKDDETKTESAVFNFDTIFA